MLKHGILGLLNYGDMTGYEIRQVFRDSLNYFWEAQTSQIYRELQTLKKHGWVTDRCVPQDGRPDKNIFSITESGKQELHRWLSEDDTGLETKNPLLMKTFFLGEMPVDENIAFFQRVRESSNAFLSEVQRPRDAAAMYKDTVSDPSKALYWKMTIAYGVMYMNMLREWSEKCIAELEAQKNEYPCD